VRAHHLRPAEKVSLEIDEALIPRLRELILRFDVFGQHSAAPRPKLLHQLLALVLRGEQQISVFDKDILREDIG